MMTLVETGISVELRVWKTPSHVFPHEDSALTPSDGCAGRLPLRGWNGAQMGFADSVLCLNYCLLCFPKVALMTWGQSQDEGQLPGRDPPSISLSLAWMRTAWGCFCLDSIREISVGGENVSTGIQALLLWLSRPFSGKPLQTFIDPLAHHCSVSSFSRGEVWRRRKTRNKWRKRTYT